MTRVKETFFQKKRTHTEKLGKKKLTRNINKMKIKKTPKMEAGRKRYIRKLKRNDEKKRMEEEKNKVTCQTMNQF